MLAHILYTYGSCMSYSATSAAAEETTSVDGHISRGIWPSYWLRRPAASTALRTTCGIEYNKQMTHAPGGCCYDASAGMWPQTFSVHFGTLPYLHWRSCREATHSRLWVTFREWKWCSFFFFFLFLFGIQSGCFCDFFRMPPFIFRTSSLACRLLLSTLR